MYPSPQCRLVLVRVVPFRRTLGGAQGLESAMESLDEKYELCELI